MTTIKNKILDIVESKKITMIPRWKFVLYSLLALSTLCFSFLLLLFVVSLVMFLFARYGFMYLPMFGFEATLHAITGIPVMLSLFGLLLALLTEVISRQFSFSFRKPLLVTLCSIVGAALVVGYFVSITPLHTMMRGYAKERHFERFNRLYEHPPHDEWHEGRAVLRGEVIATSTGSLTLSLFNSMVRMVYATGTGDSFEKVELGDDVIVFGIIHNDRFEVIKLRSSPEMLFDEKKKMRMTGEGRMYNSYMK